MKSLYISVVLIALCSVTIVCMEDAPPSNNPVKNFLPYWYSKFKKEITPEQPITNVKPKNTVKKTLILKNKTLDVPLRIDTIIKIADSSSWRYNEQTYQMEQIFIYDERGKYILKFPSAPDTTITDIQRNKIYNWTENSWKEVVQAAQ